MFLDTVNPDIMVAERIAPAKPSAAAIAAPYEVWKYFPHSCITHHGAACCETAREWFLSMDYALLAGESPYTGPRWIRARYDWGPSAHPIHWCEAVKRKALDCGALAALAIECFKERGVKAFPAQFVQRYSKDATAHWEGRWADDEVSCHWIGEDIIYHEGCAVIMPDGNIGLWDASAAWWVNPAQNGGYGSLAAVKVWTGVSTPGQMMHWGSHRIPANGWTTLGTAE